MRSNLLIFLFLMYSVTATAAEESSGNQFKLSLGVGKPNDSLSVKNSNKPETNTTFDQIEFRPTLIYFINHRLAAGAYYFQKTILAEFDSNGMGGFLRYYFMNDGTVTKSKFDNKTISVGPTWTPYFELGAKRETLEAGTVSISFSGIEAAAGLDWHWQNDFYLNFSTYTSSQLAGQNRSLTSISFLVGIGKAFSL